MAQTSRQSSSEIKIGFKSIQIFKDQELGRGGYALVCRAKCDDLLCAAKVIHPALISPHYRFHNPLRRFQQECETLLILRHPNIVQYVGVYYDPKNQGAPVLLMELMEENLTHYLEHCSQHVSYHLQISICHDVVLALSYLHTNNIVHMDVSSHSILLKDSARVAKLRGVGTTKSNHTAIFEDDEITAGCPVYLPPEAMYYNSKCTDKVDCFSFGVVMIQILTREFPNPGPPTEIIKNLVVVVPEIDRRHNHISNIDPGHPLLPIVLDCLKDRDIERPTAHQLCERVGALKESQRYTESKESTLVPEGEAINIREQLQRERQQQQQNQEEIHRLRQEIKQKEMLVEEIFENAKQQQRLAVEREVQNERRQISQLEQQLVQNQEETRRIEQELAQQLHQEQLQSSRREHELRQQILSEQQRARDRLHDKDDRIRELEHRLEQLEIDALGSHVTGLQLLPQGDSWNVPRREVQITELLGSGASGLISKGRFQGQAVAVKQIHRWILQQVYALDEFKREIGIMASIQHPNLVRFIAAVFDDRVDQLLDSPLLVLELLHTNLRDAYKKYDLSPSKSVPIFRDVAYGLHYLHEHSEPIIHRDVSAPNVLLESLPGDMWRAKLSDFGSANFLKRAKTLGVGAIVYTAPEMFPREGPSAPMPRPTTKCDVFSYGIVVVEVITKAMPTTENRHELFGEVERKWRLIYNLVSQCTEVSPHARPTMADVLNTLNRIPTARP